MASETQEHPLQGGETLEVTRTLVTDKYGNSTHRYALNGGPWQASVTTMGQYISGNTFGVASNWAVKMIRETGNLDAVKNSNRKAKEDGTALHEQVNTFIEDGHVAEENPVFVAWLKTMGHIDFVASERFVYHPKLQYGGTFDAVGIDPRRGLTLYDWKTKAPDSFEKNHGESHSWLTEQSQLAAYIHALWSMNSAWKPVRGVVCYIMRDGAYAVERQIDIEQGMRLFVASRTMHTVIKEIQNEP